MMRENPECDVDLSNEDINEQYNCLSLKLASCKTSTLRATNSKQDSCTT